MTSVESVNEFLIIYKKRENKNILFSRSGYYLSLCLESYTGHCSFHHIYFRSSQQYFGWIRVYLSTATMTPLPPSRPHRSSSHVCGSPTSHRHGARNSDDSSSMEWRRNGIQQQGEQEEQDAASPPSLISLLRTSALYSSSTTAVTAAMTSVPPPSNTRCLMTSSFSSNRNQPSSTLQVEDGRQSIVQILDSALDISSLESNIRSLIDEDDDDDDGQ